ncbi:C40 family peptidase [Streptomyces sp. NPDC060243]|uniref:C40 family peptidase n=1 Tax=Streptomyces sp. NPDC060243 TaxID=3347081 RepID=UPI00365E4B98
MKTTGAALGLLAAAPLLLAAPVLLVASTTAEASCTSTSPVDTAAVAGQVEHLLAGGKDTEVNVGGLPDPAEQIPNAERIVATGISLGVPARGQVIALAVALQESGLRNLAYGDRDSVGLFQQRPSQGWGTAEEIRDPVHAATRFYEALREVDGWQSLSLTQAAQAVQRSALPDAYAKWEDLALALQTALAHVLDPHGDTGAASLATGDGCVADEAQFGPIPAGTVPKGYTIPKDAPVAVRTAIRWAQGQLGTPYQWGGSCADAHGPDPMGRCDCSSLMQQSYAAAGLRLSRTTYTQVKEGKAVSADHLEPGDLLFTEGSATAPEHVGMYIGSGLIIHAPHTGDVVRITTLDAWRGDILAARRVV